MQILHLDSSHSILYKGLEKLGYSNHFKFKSSKEEIEKEISYYDGIIVRSRFSIDKSFLKKAINLKFIARVGSGLENIDVEYAKNKKIVVVSAPSGNSNAVGEHAIGMLLSLMNNMHFSQNEISSGVWSRESNRGFELKNKTVGIIGYGNTGKSFAKKLSGFGVQTLFYDVIQNKGDKYATEASIRAIQQKADIISIHTSLTKTSIGLIKKSFISNCKKPIWLINTSRGKCVVTKDVISGIENGKILGAALDVIDFEKKSFNELTQPLKSEPKLLDYINSKKIIITPHIAGWTHESKKNLSQITLEKIENLKL